MVGWHHRLDGHEFEQAPGVCDGQGSLACCSPWDCQESNATELNFPFDLFNPLHCFSKYLDSKSPDSEGYLFCRNIHVSVQFSRSVVSGPLRPHGLQHSRLPCPSPTPGACSNSMSIKLVVPSNHLCCPLLLLPSIFPSIRLFSNESVLCIRWPKYWSFQLSTSPSNGYSGLISFRIDWFDFLTVQGTFKSLLQHHSLKASILWC